MNPINFLDLEQTHVFPITEWGLLVLKGEDRLRFLHNQTTNALQLCQPGDWRETLFVTSTGRNLELATVWLDSEQVWVQVSAARRQPLLTWMDRFIFPFDKVTLSDQSSDYQGVILVGQTAASYLEQWQLTPPTTTQWQAQSWQGDTVWILPTTGLDLPGFTVIYPRAAHAPLLPHWQSLPPFTPAQWETLRVYQGRPEAGKELTETYNPLESGLWRAISFDKGCYIGQETIARVNTYKAVKQRLWRLQLAKPLPVGSEMKQEGKTVGIITSVAPENPLIALGYLKTSVTDVGDTIDFAGVPATVTVPPFLSHEYHS